MCGSALPASCPLCTWIQSGRLCFRNQYCQEAHWRCNRSIRDLPRMRPESAQGVASKVLMWWPDHWSTSGVGWCPWKSCGVHTTGYKAPRRARRRRRTSRNVPCQKKGIPGLEVSGRGRADCLLAGEMCLGRRYRRSRVHGLSLIHI